MKNANYVKLSRKHLDLIVLVCNYYYYYYYYYNKNNNLLLIAKLTIKTYLQLI